jgi:AraC-like DNA-binding protein
MLLLFQVLTFIQYCNTYQRVYFHYGIYMFTIWFYFARSFPPYFYFLFSNIDEYRLFHYFLRPPHREGLNNQTELILFLLIMNAYLMFTDSFFSLAENSEKVHQKLNWVIRVLLAIAIILLILLPVKDFFTYPITGLVLKNLCFLPVLWLMYTIWKLSLPCTNWILLGSCMLIIGSSVVGLIKIIGIDLFGQRVYLQLGVLAELFCFNAALGRLSWLIEVEKINLKAALDARKKNLTVEMVEPSDEFLPQLDHQIESVLKRIASRETNLKFSVTQIAADLHMSSSALLRKVNKVTGVSTEEYVLSYRLQHAHEQVLKTNMSFGEIAILTGFGENSSFSKAFKKKFGYSPSTLRKGGSSDSGEFEG